MRTERHGYKFTNKHNTCGGIFATVLAIITFISLISGIVISYKNDGNAGISVGILGTIAFLISTIGLVLGLRSFKEKDGFYVFSWIGTISNGILWIGMCLIIAAGFMMS